MKTTSILLFSLCLAVGFGLSACERSERVEAARETDSVNDAARNFSEDERFFTEYAGGMHAGEIELAKMAKDKSSNEQIKDYADAVIDSHSDALKELSDVTGQDGTPEASLDTKDHAEYLSPMSGAQFDREFIALMIADHQDASTVFKETLGTAQNKGLKNYLDSALPRLEKDLSEARKLK
jgi:putative membrane protein